MTGAAPRLCPYCGRRRYGETCAECRDLPALDPGPGDPPGFVPQSARPFWRDSAALARAAMRRRPA